jgi:predicted ATPase
MRAITLLEMRNFKCFRRQPVEFGALTVLAGLNGMGKSSVIQALLLLRQSFIDGRSRRLRLSGDLVDLGTGFDIFFDLADEDEVGFLIETDGDFRQEFLFEYNRVANSLAAKRNGRHPADLFPRTTRDASGIWEPIVSGTYPRVRPSPASLMMTSRFQYLAAERLGPRKTLPWAEEEIATRTLGTQGQHVLAFLALYGRETLQAGDPRMNTAETKETVEGQVGAWLQGTSPGSMLNISELREVDAYAARFAYQRRGDVASRPFRATNVGFGLSYVLPVLTALIGARPDDLVIIENPEAHLHPRGQTMLGELAARAAAAGVQVVIETHSDHFLDGVRVAARRGLLDPARARVHYFTRHGAEAAVISPELKGDGSLSEWPAGFFDEGDKNLIRLLAPVD